MRTGYTAIGLLLSTLALVPCAAADEPKNHDFDVVRDEALVPAFHLPPLLVTSEGKSVTTPAEWFEVRRPQIMSLFGNLIYGIVPEPELPVRTSFQVLRVEPRFMDGKATRKDVRIRFENEKGVAELTMLVFTPNGGTSAIFRAYRYGADYPGLAGKDLTPGAVIGEWASVQATDAITIVWPSASVTHDMSTCHEPCICCQQQTE